MNLNDFNTEQVSNSLSHGQDFAKSLVQKKTPKVDPELESVQEKFKSYLKSLVENRPKKR